MRKANSIIVLVGLLVSFGMSLETSNFQLETNSSEEIRLGFTNDYSIVDEYNGHRIVADNGGTTTTAGLPDIPVFSTFIQLQPGISYQASFEILESTYLHGIELLPTKGINFDQSESDGEPEIQMLEIGPNYPAQNITLSDPQVMRGVEVALLEFTPFRYHPDTNELEVFEQVDILISEAGAREMGISQTMPPSLAFEPLYESLIINYEPQSRLEDYQQPAILYICGGGSNGSIVHPLFQQMVGWREQKGYKVYTASTDETGSSNSAIKSYIQNAYQTYDPPPEFVGLVGDVDGSYSIPTFTETWSWYNGEGDMPYYQLDGNDLLPEVLVGRLSADNSTQLSVIAAKTIGYEKADHIDETGDDWYVSAALVGDPSSSGLSTITTNQYIETVMTAWEMENMFTNYGGGNYPSWMQSKLSAGIGYFNYRGYIGVSGFGSSGVNNATNVWMTPFVTFLTCSTGSFSWGEAITEIFLRAGTPSNPKGGIGAVGTATSGTHTSFNNITEMGMYEGIYSKQVETTGAALAMGKLALLHAYPTDQGNYVSIFSHWNNLMGDPAVHLWTLRPRPLSVVHSGTIPQGSNFVNVFVADEDSGDPEESAKVVFTADNGSSIIGFTNEEGIATIDIDPSFTGEFTITVVKKNCIPYQGTIEVTDVCASLMFNTENLTLEELEGNGDGLVNSNETFQVTVPVSNEGSCDLTNVTGTLSANSEITEIVSGLAMIESFSSGSAQSLTFVVSVSESAIHGDDLGLILETSDDSDHYWLTSAPIPVVGYKLQIVSYDVLNGGMLEPGMDVDFDILVLNEGVLPSGEFSIMLDEVGPWNYFEIDDNQAMYNSLSGGQSSYSNDGFHLTASNDIVHGSVLTLSAHITNDAGYEKVETLTVQVGEVSVTDPLGPDPHGYYIYDSEDLGYSLAMPYSWFEINPGLGGDGVSLGLNDNGYGTPTNQQPAHVELPFIFTFYGVDYDEITVSSNGWIALGYSEMASFRNYELPGAGGPSPMIAAFWDDLKTAGGGQAYQYYDEENGQLIIEWSGMQTQLNNSIETFQIILINSITPTGDDEILIQYNEFNNTSSASGTTHGGYCSVGIENHLGNIGLQYTFNNQYPEAALPLEDHSALFITTRQPTSLLKGDVNMDGEINILDIILVVNDVINIENLGPLEQYIADMNEDSILNVLDIIFIINEILAQ